jgi:hypothetical protein
MNNTETTDPSPFNDITITILVVLGALAVFGLWMAYDATTIGRRFGGLLCIAVAATYYVNGLKDHSPSKPKQLGLITCWGKPINNSYVVSGKAVLVPGFPFYIDTIVIDIEDKDHAFKEDDFVFQTQDGVQMKIEVSISGCPDQHDLIDYTQAGGDFKEAIERFREVIIVELQTLANKGNCLDIKRDSKRISEELKTALVGKISEQIETEGSSIGFKIKKVQIVPIIPAGLEKRMNNVAEEKFEAISEGLDYGTMINAAKNMQREVAQQYTPDFPDMDELQKSQALARLINEGKIQSLDYYIKRIEDLKLIKQDKTSGVRTTGGGKAISVINPNT